MITYELFLIQIAPFCFEWQLIELRINAPSYPINDIHTVNHAVHNNSLKPSYRYMNLVANYQIRSSYEKFYL